MRSTTLITLIQGGTVTASSEHAWPKPRGQVYLEVHDGEVEDGEECQVALTPVEAETLIDALQAALSVAKFKPEATIDAERAWTELLLSNHARGQHGGGIVRDRGACVGAGEQ